MEIRLVSFVLCVFTFQVNVIKSQEVTKKCYDVKDDLVKINETLGKIQGIKNGFDEISKEPISLFNDLTNEINAYGLFLSYDGCENKTVRDAINNLSKEISGYQSKFNIVDNFTKTTETLNSQYNLECINDTMKCPKNLSAEVTTTLESIEKSNKELADALGKFRNEVAVRTIDSTKKWSIGIFACELNNKYNKLKSVIEAFNDTLKSKNHQVELHKSILNNSLSNLLDQFHYASGEIETFNGTHESHNFSKCYINTNITKRSEDAAISCYKAFDIVIKDLSEMCVKNFTVEYKNIETKFKGCQEIKCIDNCLRRFDALKDFVVARINEYNDVNITSIINDKMEEANMKFVKDVNSSLECYLGMIAGTNAQSNLGSANFYLLLLLYVFIHLLKDTLCQ